MDRKIKHKLIGYIKRNKFRKVKKILSKNPISGKIILNSKSGFTGLHYCGKYGSIDCLQIYFESYKTEFKKMNEIRDSKGCFPIHYSIHYCLRKYSESNVKELVSFLIPYIDSNLLQLSNNEGISPQTLLEALNTKKEIVDGNLSDSSFSSVLSDEHDFQNKLNEEHQDEYYNDFGKFEIDDDEMELSEKETFDQLADRIYKEYRNKFRAPKIQSEPSSSSSSSSSSSRSKLPKFKVPLNAKKEDDLKRKKYLKKCAKIFESNQELKVSDLPFSLTDTLSDINELILADLLKSDDSRKTKLAIRKELLKWHPDKFFQKNSHRIKAESKDEFKSIINHISSSLIHFK